MRTCASYGKIIGEGIIMQMKKLYLLGLSLLGSLSLASCGNKITVTYDLNYDGSTPITQTIKVGQNPTRPNNPSRDGFDFIGWLMGVESHSAPVNFSNPLHDNTTFYASWNEIVSFHEVTIDLNYVGSTPETELVPDGNLIRERPTPTRTNYIFIGWYLDQTSTTNQFYFGNPITKTQRVYAHWKQDYLTTIQGRISALFNDSRLPTLQNSEIAAFVDNSAFNQSVTLSFRAPTNRKYFDYVSLFSNSSVPWTVRRVINKHYMVNYNRRAEAILIYNELSNTVDLKMVKPSNFPLFELSELYPTANIIAPTTGVSEGYTFNSITNDSQRYTMTLNGSTSANIASIISELMTLGYSDVLSKPSDITTNNILLDSNNRVLVAIEVTDSGKLQLTYLPNAYSRSSIYSGLTRLERTSGYDLTAVPYIERSGDTDSTETSLSFSISNLKLGANENYRTIGDMMMLYFTSNKTVTDYQYAIMGAGFSPTSEITKPLITSQSWLSPAWTTRPYYLITTIQEIPFSTSYYYNLILTFVGLAENPNEYDTSLSLIETFTGLELSNIPSPSEMGSSNFKFVILPSFQNATIEKPLPARYSVSFDYDNEANFVWTYQNTLRNTGFIENTSLHSSESGGFIQIYGYDSPADSIFAYHLLFRVKIFEAPFYASIIIIVV